MARSGSEPALLCKQSHANEAVHEQQQQLLFAQVDVLHAKVLYFSSLLARDTLRFSQVRLESGLKLASDGAI